MGEKKQEIFPAECILKLRFQKIINEDIPKPVIDYNTTTS